MTVLATGSFYNLYSMSIYFPTPDYPPSAHKLKGYSFEPVLATATTAMVNGNLYTARIPILQADTISKLYVYIVAGSGLTNTFMCLYQNGTLLSTSLDQSTLFSSSGAKEVTLPAPVAVSAGFVDVGVWSNSSTTAVAFMRAGANNGIINLNTTGDEIRFSMLNTGLTTSAPLTLTKVQSSAGMWAGVA